jgi:hypothetical protein
VNPYEPPSKRAEAGLRTRRLPWNFIVACACAIVLSAAMYGGKLVALVHALAR